MNREIFNTTDEYLKRKKTFALTALFAPISTTTYSLSCPPVTEHSELIRANESVMQKKAFDE
jgi:hypothetical protein